jgi:Resolvase, N terminal domain
VRAGKVDVIVVYEVDRLTRSLADFAKLVELFDQHNVSFTGHAHALVSAVAPTHDVAFWGALGGSCWAV